MSPTTPSKLPLSMSSPDSSPSRLPIRQKGSLLIPDLPQLTLPPLPEITNPAIKNLALTHSSAHSGERTRKRDLIYNQAEAVLDNEKLEHVGDGLLTAAVITLLHELYPAFGPGPATYLRSHMVSNRSLAQIAEQYGLPEMFIANASSKYMIQAAQKAKGSLFEAYVAGVYYSYLMPREESETESESSGDTVRPEGGRSGDISPEAESEEVGTGATTGDSVNQVVVDTIESSETTGALRPDSKSKTGPEVGPVGFLLGAATVDKEASGSTAKAEVISNFDTCTAAKHGIDDLFTLGLKSQKQVKPDPAMEGNESSSSISPSPRTPSTTSSSSTPTRAPRTHGQAFDHLCSWLWPLFTPIAHFLSTYLESESSLKLVDTTCLHPNQVQNVPNEWKIEDTKAIGAIGALNQYLGKTYGSGYLPTWIMKKRVMDVWRMVCIVRTPEGKECRAEGKRLTKKAAMTVAAYKVWQEVKAWEEEQAEKRREEEEEEDSEEGEEEIQILKKERKPRVRDEDQDEGGVTIETEAKSEKRDKAVKGLLEVKAAQSAS